MQLHNFNFDVHFQNELDLVRAQYLRMPQNIPYVISFKFKKWMHGD